MILIGWLACAGGDEACSASPCADADCADCAVVGASSDLGEAECAACAGEACAADQPPAGCEGLPCVDGVVVVRACGCDEDCAEVGLPFCGLHATAYQGVCTFSDDL